MQLTFIVIHGFNAHSNTTELLSFCLIISDTCSLNLLVGIINTVVTIILQIAGTYIILISKLHTKRNIRCKFNESRIIWFVLNRNQTIAVKVIHHGEFDTSIRSMN